MTHGIQGRKSSMYFGTARTDYLTMANLGSGVANLSPTGSEAFSISAWYFTEDNTTYTIMSNLQNAANDGYWFGMASGKAAFQWTHTNGTNSIVSSGNETAYYGGPWIHQVITYDGGGNASGLTLYTNGAFAKAGTSAVIGTTTNTSDAIEIGDGAYSSSYYGFKGSISNVSFWDKELTPAEIDYIYHGNDGGRGPGDLNYHPSFANCIGWWLSDHASDDSSTIYDSSANSNNFTVTGSPVLRKLSP